MKKILNYKFLTKTPNSKLLTATLFILMLTTAGLTNAGPSLIAGGGYHTVDLENGILYGYGANADGQLGLGDRRDRGQPTAITLPGPYTRATVIEVRAGQYHTLVLVDDGSVQPVLLAAGDNRSGQLGDGTTTDRTTFVFIKRADFRTISDGGNHSLAVLGDAGQLYAWGRGGEGQLCNGRTTMSVRTPINTGVSGVRAVSAGDQHTLLLMEDGTVKSCGNNTYGQLGDGTSTRRTRPVNVILPSNATAVAVAAGGEHSMILTDQGLVYTFGRNTFGQLCDGTMTDKRTPQRTMVRDIESIDGEGPFSLMLRKAGATSDVLTCGYDGHGELGDGLPLQHQARPVQPVTGVGPLTNIVRIAAGHFHVVAVDGSGRTWVWGDNTNGQLGTGASGSYEEAAVVQ